MGKVSVRCIVLIILIGLAPTVYCWGAGGEQIKTSLTVSTSDTAEREAGALVSRVADRGRMDTRDCGVLRLIVKRFAGEALAKAQPAERRDIVRRTLGTGNYGKLEKVLSLQMKSSDSGLRLSSMRSLSRFLYSPVAVPRLRDLVFGSNLHAQFVAICCLCSLEEPGAKNLVSTMALSGTLTDLMAGEAIEVLRLSDNISLTKIALPLLRANRGPIATYALLPVLRTRDDFDSIVVGLFKSGAARVPDTERLSLADHAKLRLESSLLEEICGSFDKYRSDDELLKKITEYANVKTHSGLYILALIAFERSGKDVSYFEGMLRDETTPKEKSGILKLIIDRIRRGERLE